MMTTNLTHLMQLAIDRTRHLLRVAQDWLGVEMPATEIRFDLRGTAAGEARLLGSSSAVIRYNPTLLARHPESLIEETVAHEVAHLVAFKRFGTRIRPHGREWQAIMRRFGVAPRRCHSHDVSDLRTRSPRRFVYRCGCRTHELTSIRHRRARTGATVYLCKQCGEPLHAETDARPLGSE